MRVLVVDDSVLIRAGIVRLLAAHAHEVRTAEDVQAAHDSVARARPDVAIVDIKLPPSFTDDGLRLATEMGERGLEILALLTQGLSDRGIADHLVISVHTVGSHVQRIFRKLGLPDGAADNRRVMAALTFLERWSG